MREDLRKAINNLNSISDKIVKLHNEINLLLDYRCTIESFIMTIEGTCEVCQNAHWPHCKED